MKTQLTLLILSLALNACGKDDNEDRKDTAAEGTNPADEADKSAADDSLLVDDEEAAGQAVTAELDDAIAAAVEENDADASAALTDAAADAEGKVTHFRECNEVGANAVVDIRREAERTLSVEGPVRKLDSSFAAYYEKQRTWSKDGAEIKCGPNKKFAALPLADMAGVKLDVTFKHERSREVTLVNKKKDQTFTRSFSYSAEGERHAIWKSVTEADGSYLTQREVTGSASRKLEIQKKDGTTVTHESAAATAEGAPLQILIERDKETLAWISRTIQSGTRTATGKDGGKVEVTFDNVKYTAEKRCTAVSGKVSGKIFKKDETTAAVTFEILFDGDAKTVTLSNGKEFDYSPEGCDLDETATGVEAATKDEVTK